MSGDSFAILNWCLYLFNAALAAGCILHCFFHKHLYRPFLVPVAAVKTFWILCLLSFSPFIIAAYCLYGFVLKHKPNRLLLVHCLNSLLILSAVCITYASAFTDSVTYEVATNNFNNNTSSTSSFISSSNRMFSMSKIAVIPQSEHAYLSKLLPVILDEIKKASLFDEIALYKPDEMLPSNNLLPDWWVQISLNDFHETTVMASMKIEANLSVVISNVPYKRQEEQVHTDELHLSYGNANIEINHTGESTRFSSPNMRHQASAENLAQEAAKKIIEFFQSNRSKSPAPPDEFARFIPEQESNDEPQIALFRGNPAFLHGKAPFLKRRSFRKVKSDKPVEEFFDEISDRLQQAGWKEESRAVQDHWNHLDMTDGKDRLVKISPVEEIRRFQHGPNKEKEEPSPNEYFILYDHLMPREEYEPLLLELLNENPSATFLMMMKRKYLAIDGEKDTYLNSLKSLENKTPELLSTLARFSKDDPQKQYEYLLQAQALNIILDNDQSSNDTYQKEIEKFKSEHPDFASTFTKPQIYESLGAQPLTQNCEDTVSRRVSLNQPISFYFESADGSIQTLAAKVIPSPYTDGSKYALQISHKTETVGGSSSTSSSASTRFTGIQCDLCEAPISIAAEYELLDEGMFFLTVTLSTETQ